MSEPWEDYQSSTQTDSGPWEDYGVKTKPEEPTGKLSLGIPQQPYPTTGPLSTTWGGPPLRADMDRGPSQTIADALSEAYDIGTADPSKSLLAIEPKGVPSGEEITQATGIPKAITIPASAIGRAGAGLGQFLTSLGGGVQVGTAALPGVGLVQRAKWIYDMASGAGETAGKLSVDVEKALKDPSAVSTEDLQSMADDTANTALMLYGSGKLSSHEFQSLTSIRAPLGRMLESDKTRYAKDLAEQLKKEQPVIPERTPQGIRQLGIPIPEGPFAQPGVPELADAALAERMQLVQPAGDQGGALRRLRSELEPPQITLETSNPAERLQGGGQAPYGKTSFMREAEAPLPERTQAALEPKPVSDVTGGEESITPESEPTKGIITGRAIESWADEVLRGGATHAGPDVLAAYMVKGVALIERGIINFAEWSAKMLAEHGPSVEPHLRDLFEAAKATIQRAPVTETGTLKSAREIVEQRLSAQSAQPATSATAQPATQTTVPPTATPTVPTVPTVAPIKPTGVKVSLDDIYKIFEPAPKTPSTIKQKGVNFIEAIRTGFSSKFRPINKLAEDIAKAYGLKSRKDIAGIMEQLKGSSGKGEAEIYRFNRDVSSLVKGQEKDFNAYMFLNRSLDRLRMDLKDIQAAQAGTYVKDLNRRSVAQYTIPELEAKLAQLEHNLGPEKVANFQKAAAEYQRYMDNALRLQVESGRMSKDVYDAIKNDNQFYAPFKVMKYLEEGMRPEGSGRKIDTVADYTKAMTGIEDPSFKLGDMLGAARQSILISRILADKATAMQHVADLAKLDTNGTFIRKLNKGEDVPDGWSQVNVFENGVKERYATRPEVAEAVQLFPGNTGGIVSRILGAFSIPFKLGATALNLPFQVSNLMADVPRQALVSKYGLRGVDDLVRYPLGLIKSFFSSMEGNIFGKDNKLFLGFS